ncbi:DUF2642 domain-containing protein [Priestia megaterium]|jgi:hypothetical protein|uniref:DUF2642 domain-containing protein n=1 Tax=Priestia megaterium TaxID=1404 RepID=UPI0021BF97DF|nr:DUF2642 domain-containing protein [Priestia megaterium]MCT9852682.1 DUF2642 domain-containing protein [Priestia megaterium]MDF1964732.1 DUF2642 domain-containing protein [Priestia megaterium]
MIILAISNEARAALLNLLGSLQQNLTSTTTEILDTTTAATTEIVNTTTTATTTLLNNTLANLLRLRLLPNLSNLRNDLTSRINQTVQLSTEYDTLSGVLLAVLLDYVVLVESDGTMNFVNLSKIETVASL